MRKRFVSLCTALVLCVLVLCPAVSLANSTTMYVDTANRKVLNMRAYMSINADIICFIPYGAAVQVNTMGGDNTWVPVSYNGYNGYCMMRYLSYNMPGYNPVTPGGNTSLETMFAGFYNADYYVSVTPTSRTGFVNLRWAPDKNAPVREIYYYGSPLHVIARNNVWAQVYDEVNKVGGFMMLDYLRGY